MLVDSHCHLDNQQFDQDREAVLERAFAAGVNRMMVIGTGDGPPDLEAAIRLADRYPALCATVGVHPHDAGKADREIYRRLEGLLKHPKVMALGEIGLDYHYDFAPRHVQRDVFVEQMRIARDARMPIVIHTREAWEDTLALIEEHWVPPKLAGDSRHNGTSGPVPIPSIMHCFSGGPAEAERCVELGFYLSFGGIVTFPKAAEVREAARTAPLDRILVETDAPYLAPVPKRGKRNEPAFMVETARKLASLRETSLEEIAAATSRNFERLINV